jgi:spore maturation protein CgeB
VKRGMDIVVLGLSITSSWGNGHATTYRSLIRGLAARGHRVLFLERDAAWYAGNRDEPNPVGATTELYQDLTELTTRFEAAVSKADVVIVGSFVPEGADAGRWVTSIAGGVTVFYDIDTPVTLAKLEEEEWEYITPGLIRRYDMYLSFTGGPALKTIERRYGSPMARVLYCSVDPRQYSPVQCAERWDLGYLGTYSDDRQPSVERFIMEPARRWSEGRFAVVGPLYPETIEWPRNVDREIHLSPREHPRFYGSQRFTLNVTRDAMKKAGYSPSVRLFEAGSCGVPVISDWWEGLDTIFRPDREVLLARDSEDVLRYLRDFSDPARRAIGEAARRRILAEHTPEQRAMQLESYIEQAGADSATGRPARRPQVFVA